MRNSLKYNTQGYLDLTAATAIALADRSKNKYGNIKTKVDGIIFDSKKEARRYTELKILERSGIISNLRLQMPFELVPKQKGERAVKYYADFVYIENDKTIVEDTKSEATRRDRCYILKRKVFKLKYPDHEFRET